MLIFSLHPVAGQEVLTKKTGKLFQENLWNSHEFNQWFGPKTHKLKSILPVHLQVSRFVLDKKTYI